MIFFIRILFHSFCVAAAVYLLVLYTSSLDTNKEKERFFCGIFNPINLDENIFGHFLAIFLVFEFLFLKFIGVERNDCEFLLEK